MFGTILFALVAAFWLLQAALLLRGLPRLPRISEAEPLTEPECPRISILFAARDEEEKLPQTLAMMLALDYPNCEVVAVNDRSCDATPQILEAFARLDARLKVVHIAELPPGWLGKTHGLQHAYEASSGEWLVFTDADVRFAPGLLRRAMRIVLTRGWDHLTLLSPLELEGFWEKAPVSFAWLLGILGIQPWSVPNPKTPFFAGAGYFQMVRRSAYEQSGTHRKLALEVVDDMKLGKMIKRGGFRSGVGLGTDFVTLRWYHGLGNTIRGVTKNLFAGVNFSLPIVLLVFTALLTVSVLPFFGVWLADGWGRVLAGIAAFLAVGLQAFGAAGILRISPLYGFTHPLGATLFLYMLLRSTVVTLWQGGVVWRDTFYPLDELRKGIV